MPNNFHEACKFLVVKFCKGPIDWPKEIKFAKKLLQLSPDTEAWDGIDLGFKLNSLAYFLGDGKEFVPTSQRNPYLLDLTPATKKKKGKKTKPEKLEAKTDEKIEDKSEDEEAMKFAATKSVFEFLR